MIASFNPAARQTIRRCKEPTVTAANAAQGAAGLRRRRTGYLAPQAGLELGGRRNVAFFGLGAALARQLEVGAARVNDVAVSGALLAFGGARHSEKVRGPKVQGVCEFTNAKTIWTEPARR